MIQNNQKETELKELRDSEAALSELHLEHKEKWYAVKDFIDGNDALKMRDFENWVKKFYIPQRNKLSRRIKALKDKWNM